MEKEQGKQILINAQYWIARASYNFSYIKDESIPMIDWEAISLIEDLLKKEFS